MKRRVEGAGSWLFWVLGMSLVLGLCIAASAADTPVTIPDPELESAIRTKLGKPTGDLYQGELAAMAGGLPAQNRGISDLEGLQYCTGISGLYLEGNSITDVSPLAGLTGLTTLYLHFNSITDVSPLAGLTGLVTLYLYGNAITDASSLSGLTALESLSLGGNPITDIALLSGFTSLTYVSLHNGNLDITCPDSAARLVIQELLDRGCTVNWLPQNASAPDAEPPSIACADITANTDAGQCYATGVDLGTPTTADNCTVASVSNDAPIQFPKGDTVVTWTVTDTSGNTATCAQTVTVVDGEDPWIALPEDISDYEDYPRAGVAVIDFTVDYGDNCPGAELSQTAGLASGSEFPMGTTTNTFVVTDGAGRTATCSFEVTVAELAASPGTYDSLERQLEGVTPVEAANILDAANSCIENGAPPGTTKQALASSLEAELPAEQIPALLEKTAELADAGFPPGPTKQALASILEADLPAEKIPALLEKTAELADAGLPPGPIQKTLQTLADHTTSADEFEQMMDNTRQLVDAGLPPGPTQRTLRTLVEQDLSATEMDPILDAVQRLADAGILPTLIGNAVDQLARQGISSAGMVDKLAQFEELIEEGIPSGRALNEVLGRGNSKN